MNDYVIINGVNSNTISGLKISKLPPITKPQMRTLIETIDGRDGDLITDLGYSAYDKQLEIGLWGTYDINEIISFFNQSGTITFSNEADKFYNFKIINQIDYQKLLKFKTAVVVMHCQPFKYPTNETPIEGTPTTITGEGTTLTLNNTLQAPLEIDLKGNTYQYSTTGKNLYKPISYTRTHYGVDFTYSIDGTIKVENTATSNATSLPLQVAIDNNYLFLLKSGTYTLSGGISSEIRLQVLDSNGTTLATDTGNNNTFTINEDTNVYVRIYVTSGTATNVTFYPMINEGQTALPYEPYTGGIPSPNPDYPQDIQVVSGDNTIKVEGKNLFDKNNANILQMNLADISTTSGSSPSNRVLYMPIKPNTTYTVSKAISAYFVIGTTESTPTFNLAYSQRQNDATAKSLTITTSSTAKYLILWYYNSGADTLTEQQILDSIQIEYGSSSSTYTPYVSQTYPIYLGVENLFDETNITTGKRLTATGELVNGSGYYTSSFIKVLPNTKYCKNSPQEDAYHRVCFYTSNDQTTFISKTEDNSFTTPTTCNYIRFCGEETELDNTKLTQGDHIQHISTTPIELCKIGDYQDKIYKDSGKWYLHKEIGKYVYNNDLATNYITENEVQMLTPVLDVDSSVASLSNKAFCNIMGNEKTNYTGLNGTTSSSKIKLSMAISYASSYSEFREIASNNNLTIYYVLATPTNTEITGELLSQLNALEGANSYDNQTNISQVNNDYPFWLSASTTFNAPITINNIGNIYAKPILELEGSGNITINLNSHDILAISLGENTTKIVIDIPNLEAYNPTDSTLMNRLVVGDYMKFLINSGNNTLKIDGTITSYRLTSYTRWI